jgi:hypothetical protein
MKKLFIAMTLVTAAASASAATKDDAKINNKPNGTAATSYVKASTPNGLSANSFNIFAGNTWTPLATTGATSGSTSLGGALLSWTFAAPTAKNSTAGTFTITSNKAITIDLGFGVTSNKQSGEWFFDNLKLAAGTTSGTYDHLEWVNFNGNGNITNGFSGSMYARDVTVSPVPEPESYAMMLGALGMIGFVARRKKRS